MKNKTVEIGLVLQGGGALGAYEWGAIQCLIEHNFTPNVIAGVSIGAYTAAIMAGAPEGEIRENLNKFWHSVTIEPHPFLQADNQSWLSMFGNPNYWKPRMDFFSSSHWNSLNDVEPMKKTLAELIDFDRLNNADLIRIGIVATNIRTGEGHSFMNGQKKKLRLEHILASGALPPSFAPVEIDHHHYWDGGLVDNTPALTLCRMLTEKERQSLPIFCIDLFPEHGPIPKTLHEVQHRMLEIQYENRLNGPDNVVKHAHDLIRLLSDKLPANSEIRKSEPFKTLQPLLALENLHSVGAPHMPMTGGMDFSAHGIKRRHDIGYRVMEEYLEENKDDILKKAA